jgi:hypothetical protein
MAKKNRANPYAGMTADQIIAATDADVRYGGQLTQIKDLYRQAAKQKKSDIGAAKETAASTIAYANAQRPTIKDVYRRGVQQANKTSEGVNAVLTRSLGADSPYAAEIAAETGGSKNRINEAKIGALTDLTNRATGAVAGRAAAINQARAAYGENKRTLGTKLSDLLGEKGAYKAGRLATLYADAADRAVDVADRAAAGERANTVIQSGPLASKTQQWVKNHPQQAQGLVDAWNKAHPAGGKPKVTKPGSSPIAKFQVKIGDAIGDLNRLANTNITIQKPDPKNEGKFIPVTKPAIQFGAEGRQKILGEMRHLRYTPQEIAIARTINRGDKLSSADLSYLKTLGVHLKNVPRGWLSYNTLISQGRAAGPPTPGRG